MNALALFCMLLAHHSLAMFDVSKTVTYTGTVTRFSYTNPHIYVYADVEKDGRKVNYRVEGDSPVGLRERGWNSKTLAPGEKITIVAHPTKDNSNFGIMISITKADGKKLEAGVAP